MAFVMGSGNPHLLLLTCPACRCPLLFGIWIVHICRKVISLFLTAYQKKPHALSTFYSTALRALLYLHASAVTMLDLWSFVLLVVVDSVLLLRGLIISHVPPSSMRNKKKNTHIKALWLSQECGSTRSTGYPQSLRSFRDLSFVYIWNLHYPSALLNMFL